MKTEYKSVRFCFPARVTPGRARNELDAHGNIKLTRVTENGRDTLHVAGVGGAVEVPWANVASAERLPEPAKSKA